MLPKLVLVMTEIMLMMPWERYRVRNKARAKQGRCQLTENERKKITELKIERFLVKRSYMCALSLRHCFLTRKLLCLIMSCINIRSRKIKLVSQRPWLLKIYSMTPFPGNQGKTELEIILFTFVCLYSFKSTARNFFPFSAIEPSVLWHMQVISWMWRACVQTS